MRVLHHFEIHHTAFAHNDVIRVLAAGGVTHIAERGEQTAFADDERRAAWFLTVNEFRRGHGRRVNVVNGDIHVERA